jgi:hypothetical protein
MNDKTQSLSPAFKSAMLGMLAGCVLGALIELSSPDGKRRHLIIASRRPRRLTFTPLFAKFPPTRRHAFRPRCSAARKS